MSTLPGTPSTAVQTPPAQPGVELLPGYRVPALLVAALTVLLFIAYWPTLNRTAEFLLFSEDMAHGFFAPVIAAYVVWAKAGSLQTVRLQPSAWSIPLFAVAAALGVIGTLGASTTLTRCGLMVSLSALLLLMGGARAFLHFSFPLGLLLFTFPIPPVLYGEITLPLQLLATRLAEGSFELLGYSVVRNGNILELANQKLAVAEAC